jgi:hypothetical protein
VRTEHGEGVSMLAFHDGADCVRVQHHAVILQLSPPLAA